MPRRSFLNQILSVGKPPGKTRVVNKDRATYDVLIMRGTKWGNPFRIGPDGDRDEVIQKFREWVVTQPQLMASLHELKGKVLGCCCFPLACHGHVLADLADALPDTAQA